MQLCNQMRKSNISGGNLDALEEKKACLLKELEVIQHELHGFEQEGLQSPLVLEDWQGLVNSLESVKKKFKKEELEEESDCGGEAEVGQAACLQPASLHQGELVGGGKQL